MKVVGSILAIVVLVGGCGAPRVPPKDTPGIVVPCEVCGTNGTPITGLADDADSEAIDGVTLPSQEAVVLDQRRP